MTHHMYIAFVFFNPSVLTSKQFDYNFIYKYRILAHFINLLDGIEYNVMYFIEVEVCILIIEERLFNMYGVCVKYI